VQEAILNSLEVSCGCLQKKDGSFIDIPPIEIIPQINSFFDYDSKYTKGGSMEITPPKSIDKKMSDKIIRLAQEIHKELGCRLYSRSDFLVKDGKVYFLELNTLPGMTSTSLIPQECNAIGMSYTDLVTFLIENT
jgi:D-alanine-D-alanine ligase